MKESTPKLLTMNGVPRPYCSVIFSIIGLLIIISVLHTSSRLPKDFKIQLPSFGQSSVKSKIVIFEKAYQRFVSKRKALVGPDPSKINPWPRYGPKYFYDYFLPTFSCPHSTERVGTFGDGGKYICGLELFTNEESNEFRDQPCLVYSFGVSRESSFEKEMLDRTTCDIYAYDASVTKMGPQIPPQPNPRVHFKRNFIGSKDAGSVKTLGTLMKENGHKWIDIIKIDVEGAEIDALNQIMDQYEYFPFGQLSIEIHGDEDGKLFPKIYKLWERMEQVGLRPYINEINNGPCMSKKHPVLMEYGFINLRGDHRLIV